MGDSEEAVAQQYSNMEYTTTDNAVDGSSAGGVSEVAAEELVAPLVTTTADNLNISSKTDKASNDSSHSTGTDSESKNDALGGITENGSHSYGANGVIAEPQEMEDKATLSPEEERLWSIVKTNSLDFTAWTSLIEETEKVAENDISKIRKVYDAFLLEFPLCYGYWKKYADHEVRIGSVDRVMEVYERAVLGVTYSVDIWLHYCTFAINTYGDPDTVRRLFERGLAYVGTDYLSSPLWDKFIEYEYMQQDWPRLATIYTRVLENPIQQLDRYFNSFRELVASKPLSELKTVEEAAAATTTSLEVCDHETTGGVDVSATGEVSKPVSAGLAEAEDLEKYIAIREEMFKKAKEFDSKIIGFETAIRRPYFHVRPLNVAELENWHSYLGFIEAEGDFNKIVKLYERCIIACANYPEYWMRYVLCMEASGAMDLANNALARATQVFVKTQPEIHLFAARFKENSGDIEGARAAYQLIHTEISPGLIEAIIKHANMEHRLGNLEDAFSVYEQAIAIEKGKEQSQTLPFLFAQYARFFHLVAGNVEKSREILNRALENVQLSKPLLEALILLESMRPHPKQLEYLDAVVERFIVPTADNANSASIADREDLSSIFLEFLDLFGNAQFIKKADDRHAKLFLHHKIASSESRKRQAEDFLTSDRSKMAKAYAGSSPSVPVVGAYPTAQTQWPATYGSQVAQVWPQGQQWNHPGYTQQAAYAAAYGGAYANPPTSGPQTTLYGAYPPANPAQPAFPQQAYAPPSASAVAAPLQHQQPAAVPAPQAYYGNYYG